MMRLHQEISSGWTSIYKNIDSIFTSQKQRDLRSLSEVGVVAGRNKREYSTNSSWHLGIPLYLRTLIIRLIILFHSSPTKTAGIMKRYKKKSPISEYLFTLTIDGAEQQNKKAKIILFLFIRFS